MFHVTAIDVIVLTLPYRRNAAWSQNISKNSGVEEKYYAWR